ncbi:MAG: response regulator, partial [Verrucomicrobia bacterium]|nr:response regulator [Verrucomicrobiota bacterium]
VAELRHIRGAAPRLFEVLMNLCFNARDAMPSGGKLVLSVENFEADAAFTALQPDARAGKYVVFAVVDTGFGIGPKVRAKLFTPGFTTKAGKHAGLGLSNALNIVRGHGGFITVQSEPGWGATMRVHLPACDSTETAHDDDLDTMPPPGSGEGVLLVDDEPSVRATCKAALEQFGYRPFLAGDGDAALASFAEGGDDIRAVITDLSMPMLGGATVVSAVKRMKPGVKVIVASGFLDDDRRAELRALGCDAFLSKPYTIVQLLRVLRDTLRG